MSSKHVKKLKKAALLNLKEIKKVVKNLKADKPVPAYDIATTVDFSTELLAQLQSLSGIALHGETVGICEDIPAEPQAETIPTTMPINSGQLGTLLTNLRDAYQFKVKEVRTSQFDMSAFATFNDITLAYSLNTAFNIHPDKLLFLTLNLPDGHFPELGIWFVQVMFYTNPVEWSNLANTCFEVVLTNGQRVAFGAEAIPKQYYNAIISYLQDGKPDESTFPEPEEKVSVNLDPLDKLADVTELDVGAAISKLISRTLYPANTPTHFYNLTEYTNLQSVREAVGDARLLRHTYYNSQDYLLTTVSIDPAAALHGYDMLHVLHSTASSLASHAIFELVNNTDKSLARCSLQLGITQRQEQSIRKLISDGTQPVYPATTLEVSVNLPDIDEPDWPRISTDEDLSDYVVKLPSGTLSIDPRVTEALSSLSTKSVSIMRRLNRYLPNFIPVIDTPRCAVPHGPYRHCVLRAAEQHHRGTIADFYIRTDTSYADMVLRMRTHSPEILSAVFDPFEIGEENTLTLTWHGIVDTYGKIQFPIDQGMFSKMYFTFHTRGNPNGTAVQINNATNHELKEIFATLEEQFAKWDALGTKPDVKPLKVSVAEVYQSSMPAGQKFPEEAAVKAIVDGTLTLQDIRKPQ